MVKAARLPASQPEGGPGPQARRLHHLCRPRRPIPDGVPDGSPRAVAPWRYCVRAAVGRRVRRFATPAEPTPKASAAPPHSCPGGELVVTSPEGAHRGHRPSCSARRPAGEGRVRLSSTRSGPLTVAAVGGKRIPPVPHANPDDRHLVNSIHDDRICADGLTGGHLDPWNAVSASKFAVTTPVGRTLSAIFRSAGQVRRETTLVRRELPALQERLRSTQPHRLGPDILANRGVTGDIHALLDGRNPVMAEKRY